MNKDSIYLLLDCVKCFQNSRGKNDPIRKWAKDKKGHFPTDDTQMANEYMKICSTSLDFRKMQIKTTTDITSICVTFGKKLATTPNVGKNR